MKVGQFITFYLDQWEDDKHFLKKVKAIVKDICTDPLKIQEPKCSVKVNGELYGVPFSEVLEVSPAKGEQLILKL